MPKKDNPIKKTSADYALFAVLAWTVIMELLSFLFFIDGKVTFLGNTVSMSVVTSIPGSLSICVYTLMEYSSNKKWWYLLEGLFFGLITSVCLYQLFL